MTDMFFIASSFNQNISNWNVSNVTNMSAMFAIAKAFNQNISNWNVSNVTNMSGMFASAEAFNQNLSGWCVTNIGSEPTSFDLGATAWVLANSRPIWGTCP
jgi:surface protein